MSTLTLSSLRTTASPALQGALNDGFGEAAVVWGTPEQRKFPSLDSCQKRFLLANKEVDLAPLSIVGLFLLVGNAEKFPRALGLVWILFFQSESWVHFSQP